MWRKTTGFMTLPSLYGMCASEREWKMSWKNIGIRIQPIFEKDGVRVRMLKVWLFWEDKPYPLNFIGMGCESIARNLDISELQAIKLLVLKLKPEIVNIGNPSVRDKAELRLRHLEKKLILAKTRES